MSTEPSEKDAGLSGRPGAEEARRWRRWALVVVILATGIRLVGWLALVPGRGIQGSEFFEIATVICEGRGFARVVTDAKGKTIDYTTTAANAPGYVGVCLAAIALTGDQDYRNYAAGGFSATTFVLQGVNLLLQAATVYLAMLLARKLVGTTAGLAAGAAAAIHPAMIIFSWGNYDTCWTTFLLVLLVYSVARLRTQRIGIWHLLWLGLLCGTLSLFNPTPAFAYVLLLLWGLRDGTTWRAWREAFRRSLIVFVIHCVVISPLLIRNFAVFHRLWYVRSSLWMQMWCGNNPATMGGLRAWPPKYGEDAYWYNFPTTEMLRWHEMGEAAYSQYCRDRVMAEIGEHPGRFMLRCGYRSLGIVVGDFLLIPTERFGRKKVGWIVLSLGYGAGSLFALCGILAARRRKLPHAGFVLGMIALTVLPFLLVFTGYRYLVPVVPLEMTLGSYCLAKRGAA